MAPFCAILNKNGREVENVENVVNMLDAVLTWIWNRNNITLVIAVLGFGMSLYNFFRSLWDRRCDFRVDYVSHYCTLSRSGKYAEPMFRLNFINRSSAPLTVVRMFLCVENEKYEFLFPEQMVYQMTHTENGKTVQAGEVRSQALPFRVEGNGAMGGYFAVYLPPEMKKQFQSAGKWKLTVQTTRKKKSFLLAADNPGYDIEQYTG